MPFAASGCGALAAGLCSGCVSNRWHRPEAYCPVLAASELPWLPPRPDAQPVDDGLRDRATQFRAAVDCAGDPANDRCRRPGWGFGGYQPTRHRQRFGLRPGRVWFPFLHSVRVTSGAAVRVLACRGLGALPAPATGQPSPITASAVRRPFWLSPVSPP